MKRLILTCGGKRAIRVDSPTADPQAILKMHGIHPTSWDGSDLQFISAIERDHAYKILHAALPHCSLAIEDVASPTKRKVYYKLRVHEN